MNDTALSAIAAVSEGSQLPRRRISEMAAGDSESKALE
jgi:hypothetical protein